MHFFTEGSVIMDYGLVKNVLMLDLFQLLSSPDVNWWTGVVWIIVMFLSALILTAPIHCRASIATFLQTRWRNKLILIMMTWWGAHFQQIFVFERTIPLISHNATTCWISLCFTSIQLSARWAHFNFTLMNLEKVILKFRFLPGQGFMFTGTVQPPADLRHSPNWNM